MCAAAVTSQRCAPPTPAYDLEDGVLDELQGAVGQLDNLLRCSNAFWQPTTDICNLQGARACLGERGGGGGDGWGGEEPDFVWLTAPLVHIMQFQPDRERASPPSWRERWPFGGTWTVKGEHRGRGGARAERWVVCVNIMRSHQLRTSSGLTWRSWLRSMSTASMYRGCMKHAMAS